MKATCQQENLQKALSIVGRAAASRASLPICQNTLMNAEGNFLRLTATDLAISMTAQIPAEVTQEGSTTVPNRLMTELVNALPKEQVSMENGDGSHQLKINCLSAESNIVGMDPEEFPKLPQVEDASTFLLDAEHFRKAIARVTPCAASNDSRPVLTGIYIKLQDQQFTMVGADGFRLAVHQGQLGQTIEEPAWFIVPARALNEILRIKGNNDEAIKLTVSSSLGYVLFETMSSDLDGASVQMTSQLISGTYPDYEQLLPKARTTTVLVDRKDLHQATKRAAIFAKDNSNIIRFQVSPKDKDQSARVHISARAQDVGTNEQSIDAIDMEGKDVRIAFNSHYLDDLLHNINDPQITMELTETQSPAVFKPSESSDYLQVVMPMFLKDD